MEESQQMDRSGCAVALNANFAKDKHVRYFLRCLNVLPGAYTSLDTSRVTVLFFAISGLDLLGALDKLSSSKKDLIDWIYSLQILPGASGNTMRCGFRGGPFLGGSFNATGLFSGDDIYEGSHIAMTYTALCTLLILGDDLTRVNKDAVILSLKSLQLSTGSFCSTVDGSENDMRFLYCACCISFIMNDWRGVNVDTALDFIRNSMNYDCGLSQGPQLESHGGSTYCAIASLTLMNCLHACFSPQQVYKLRQWCLVRQKSGFQGRPNKPVDTCYSFWVGASLKLLDSYNFVNHEQNMEFLLSTQDELVGGFSKWPDVHADALHTYFGICGLSLMSCSGVEEIHPALNISSRAYKHLMELHTL